MRARRHVTAAAFTPVTPAEPVPGDAAGWEVLGRCWCGGAVSGRGCKGAELPPHQPQRGCSQPVRPVTITSSAAMASSRRTPRRERKAKQHDAPRSAVGVPPPCSEGGPAPASPWPPPPRRSPLYKMAGPSGRISSARAAAAPRGAGGSSCQHALDSAACARRGGQGHRGGNWGEGG